MLKTKKLLMIGPFPEPISGVSLANQILLDGIKKSQSNVQVDHINTSLTEFSDNTGNLSLNKVFFYLKFNFKLYKIFKSTTIYITVGQSFFGVVKYSGFIILSKLLKKELIIHLHGGGMSYVYNNLKGIKKRILKKLLSLADKGIVLSNNLKSNFLHFINSKKIHILFNFVEPLFILDKKEIESKLQKNEINIFFLSNLMEEKGIFQLIEALKILEHKKLNFKAKLAGNIDVKNQEKIFHQIKKLNSTSYIGVVKNKEKLDLLKWGNIFILPTFHKTEGQPISILEAIASGNIVVSTFYPGISDIFSNGLKCVYIEKENSNDIASKLQKIISNLDEYKRQAISNFDMAKHDFTVDRFVNGFLNILFNK